MYVHMYVHNMKTQDKNLLQECQQIAEKYRKNKIKKTKKPQQYRLYKNTTEKISTIAKHEQLNYDQLFNFFIKLYEKQ